MFAVPDILLRNDLSAYAARPVISSVGIASPSEVCRPLFAIFLSLLVLHVLNVFGVIFQ